jgi:hypothetical protein
MRNKSEDDVGVPRTPQENVSGTGTMSLRPKVGGTYVSREERGKWPTEGRAQPVRGMRKRNRAQDRSEFRQARGGSD